MPMITLVNGTKINISEKLYSTIQIEARKTWIDAVMDDYSVAWNAADDGIISKKDIMTTDQERDVLALVTCSDFFYLTTTLNYKIVVDTRGASPSYDSTKTLLFEIRERRKVRGCKNSAVKKLK